MKPYLTLAKVLHTLSIALKISSREESGPSGSVCEGRAGLISKGRTIWITGLSGAGKSTLAVDLTGRLRALGQAVVMLDGDELREVFGAANAQSHSRERRLTLAMQYACLCRVIAKQGMTVVIATISLFREVLVWNRENLPGYFEVYLKVPLEELRRRDSKGIYRAFDAGKLANVTGLDLSIDEPEAADLIFEFLPGQTVDAMVDELINQLTERKSP
jgi:adenylylsulfate kinase-like enzyme